MKFEKEKCVWWLPHKTKTTLKHALNLFQKLENGKRRWHPLRFHVDFKLKKKRKKKSGVCGDNAARHTINMFQSNKRT